MSNTGNLNVDSLPWIVGDVMTWAVSSDFQLALLIWILTIGVGELSRILESIFFNYSSYARPRFWGYFYGDWALAATGFVAYRQIERFHGSDRFYVQPWWYAIMLGVGAAISLSLEVQAVLANDQDADMGYTWQQELTLSKLVHTLGFAIVFAILASLLPIVLVAGSTQQAVLASVMAFGLVAIWVGFNVLDMKFRDLTYLLVEAHPHPSRYAQKNWPWRQSAMRA